MKFETPRIDINVFSENVVTSASGNIATSATVGAAKDVLTNDTNNIDSNNIITFTFD